MTDQTPFLDDADDDEQFFSFMTAYNNHVISEIDLKEGDSASLVTHRAKKMLNRVQEEQIFINDYFIDLFDENLAPRFNAQKFRRRFRMRRSLFLRISEDLDSNGKYFRQRPDATGLLGHSTWRKVAAAMRLLAYGISYDMLEEILKIGATTGMKSLKNFCIKIIQLYEEEYMRTPNEQDLKNILAENEKRNWTGCVGSIDCLHWRWLNCCTAWHGQYTGKEKNPTLILEAVATQDLWIWHAYFGLPGSLNDLNVLDRSPVFDALLQRTLPDIKYTVNGREYTKPYYLADGIYPEWATFVKSIKNPKNLKEKEFSKNQETARKDVERCFGVLQQRFHVISQPAKMWKEKDVRMVMKTCIILHNMIVEDHRKVGFVFKCSYGAFECI